MSGLEKNLPRRDLSEETLDREFSEGITERERLIREVNKGQIDTGMAARGLVSSVEADAHADSTLESPSNRPSDSSRVSLSNRPNVTTELGLAQDYAQTRADQYTALGRNVEPRVYHAQVSTRSLETAPRATRMPDQYNIPHFPLTQQWEKPLYQPVQGLANVYKGVAWDLDKDAPASPGTSRAGSTLPGGRIVGDLAGYGRTSIGPPLPGYGTELSKTIGPQPSPPVRVAGPAGASPAMPTPISVEDALADRPQPPARAMPVESVIGPGGPTDRAPGEQVAHALRVQAALGPAPGERGTSDIRPFGEAVESIATGMSSGAGMPARTDLVGTAMPGPQDEPLRVGRYVDEATGDIKIPGDVTKHIQTTMSKGFSDAAKQYGGMDPKLAVANMQRALHNVGKAMVDNLEAEGKKLAGGDPKADMENRQLTSRVRSVVNKMAYSAVDALEKDQGVAGAAEAGRGATPVSDRDFQRFATGDYGTAEQNALQGAIASAGGARAVASGGLTWQMASGGMAQVAGSGPVGGSPWVPGGDLGSTGGGGGGRGGRGGLWGGDLGGVMYGAYIAKRFWGYTGAPVMQAMQQYADVQGQLEPLMTGEIPTEGAGAYSALKGRASYALGQGAYNFIGAPMTAAAKLMEDPNMASLAANAGLIGGTALTGKILGGVLSSGIGEKIVSRLPEGLVNAGGRVGAIAGRVAPIANVGGAVLGGFSAGAAGTNWLNQAMGAEPTGFSTLSAIQRTAQRGTQAALSLSFMAEGAIFAGIGTVTGDMPAAKTMFEGRIENTLGIGDGAFQRFLEQDYGAINKEAEEISDFTEELGIDPEELPGLVSVAVGISGQQGLEGPNKGLISAVSKLMKTRGISEGAAGSLMGGYASSLGYLPGQTEFAEQAELYGGLSVGMQASFEKGAESRAAKAGPFRQIISSDTMSTDDLLRSMDVYDTQQTANIAFGGASRLIAGGLGQRTSKLVADWGGAQVAAGRWTQNQLSAGMSTAATISDYLGPSFGRDTSVMQAFGDMSQVQMNLAGRIAGGDLGAMSFAANTGTLPGFEGMALTDLSGRSTYMSNLQQGMLNLQKVGQQIGLGPGLQYQGAGADMMSQFMQGFESGGMGQGLRDLGVTEDMASFFENDPDAGLIDYKRDFSDKQFGRQMAGIGIGFQKIALQRQFQYGGGDWRNPTSDSLWGIQDQMRSLQWQGQQASSAFTMERMDVGNQFAMRQEDISSRRMGVQQDYQRWGMGFQRAGMDLSRQFTIENRQFQDQMRGMQTSATLEDFEENIRMSSGRQRRQLVTQRERFVAMTGVQDEQTDRGREQQEELWAREDEQFDKKREYTENLIVLDKEQFNMGVERREVLFDMDREDLERRITLSEKLHVLQEQQLEKQREYAVAQMDLAQQALGIQAASAIAQKNYNDNILTVEEDLLSRMEDEVKTITANDPTGMLEALSQMAKDMNTMGEKKPESIVDMIKAINEVQTGKLRDLIGDINNFNYVP